MLCLLREIKYNIITCTLFITYFHLDLPYPADQDKGAMCKQLSIVSVEDAYHVSTHLTACPLLGHYLFVHRQNG